MLLPGSENREFTGYLPADSYLQLYAEFVVADTAYDASRFNPAIIGNFGVIVKYSAVGRVGSFQRCFRRQVGLAVRMQFDLSVLHSGELPG